MTSRGIVLTEYTRTPKPVKGIVLTADNIDALAIWCGGQKLNDDRDLTPHPVNDPMYLKVPHVNKTLFVNLGDLLMKGDDGRFSRIAKADFEEEYERKSPIFVFDRGTPFTHESGLPGLPGAFPGAGASAQVLRQVKSPRNVQ